MGWFNKKKKDTEETPKADKKPVEKPVNDTPKKKSSWMPKVGMPKVDLSEMFDKSVLASIDGAKKVGDLAKSATEASKKGLESATEASKKGLDKVSETTKGATSKIVDTSKKLGKGTADKAGNLTKSVTDGAKAATGKTVDVASGLGKSAKSVAGVVGKTVSETEQARQRQTSGNAIIDLLLPVTVSKEEIKKAGEKKAAAPKSAPAPAPKPKK